MTKNLTPVRIGTFLALLIAAFQPNFGIVKYGPSPAVPAFFLFVLGAWFIWKERNTLFAAPAQRRWLTVFLLLFVPVAISVPGSFNFRTSLNVAFVMALYFFVGVALLRTLRDDSERAWLVKWISWVLLFWAADSILQALLGSDLFGIARGPDGRVTGPFAENLHLSVLMIFLLPLLFVWLLPRGIFLALAAFMACGAVALLGGSRSTLFFLAVGAVGIIIRAPGARIKGYIIAAVVVVGIAATAFSPVLQERFSRFGALRAPTPETIDRLLSYRLTIWDNAVNMAADRPLRGVGAGVFQDAYSHYSTRSDDVFLRGRVTAHHAHQLFVGVMAETGVSGLVAFIVALLLCIKWYLGAPPQRRTQAWPWGLGLVIYGFPLYSQPPLYSQWLFPVILLLLAGMLAALDEPRIAGTPPASRV